ncbi:hypothetical protein EST38_g7169 [Candolleomyces aberdarensis]|uniref:Uncharacterized protein n=1 Tax=Candolleomyces aberdarensis TaxID=2316362 RepID=A0A4Q2DFX6_9AGAR|nr:hypothetical protein EST38_g7169 [Candolleomyces aberdarensis]
MQVSDNAIDHKSDLIKSQGSFPMTPVGYLPARPSSTPINSTSFQTPSQAQRGLALLSPHPLSADGWGTGDQQLDDNEHFQMQESPDASFSSNESFFLSQDSRSQTVGLLPISSTPQSAPAADSSRIISEDLYNRVVSEYQLSVPAQTHLNNLAMLMAKAGTPKSHAIPPFIQLAATLRIHDILGPQTSRLPAVEGMNEMYEKFDNFITAHAATGTLSQPQKENIRALVGYRVFDKGVYEFSDLKDKVMDTLKKKSDYYGLKDALSTPAGERAVQGKVGPIISSVVNNFREEIFHSIDKHPAPLARFAHQCGRRYIKGTNVTQKIEKGHLIKLALLRRFMMDYPEVGVHEGGARGKRKKTSNSDSSSNSDGGTTAAASSAKATRRKTSTRRKTTPPIPPMLTQTQDAAPPGKVVSFLGEIVDDPPYPISVSFISVWEWFVERQKLLVGPFGSPNWISYMEWVVSEDTRMFPLAKGEVVPGVSKLLQDAASRTGQISTAVPAITLVPTSTVAYDSVTL